MTGTTEVVILKTTVVTGSDQEKSRPKKFNLSKNTAKNISLTEQSFSNQVM